MKKTIMLLFFLSSLVSFAVAQNDDFHKFEVSGGYSYNRYTDDGESIGFNGFNASVTGNLKRYVGLKFDFSGHYKKARDGNLSASLSNYNYLAGIQIKDNSKDKKVKPFANFLIGGTTAKARVSSSLCGLVGNNLCTETTSGLAMAVGGGLDVKVSKRVDIRVIQADYNPNRLGGSWNNSFRVGFGIVIH